MLGAPRLHGHGLCMPTGFAVVYLEVCLERRSCRRPSKKAKVVLEPRAAIVWLYYRHGEMCFDVERRAGTLMHFPDHSPASRRRLSVMSRCLNTSQEAGEERGPSLSRTDSQRLWDHCTFAVVIFTRAVPSRTEKLECGCKGGGGKVKEDQQPRKTCVIDARLRDQIWSSQSLCWRHQTAWPRCKGKYCRVDIRRAWSRAE
ncbi:uncharacterized protein B0I36DRAFT_309898 [Microdochium trichocladiopsis]|uniref:Uncharacterized protein n=1 Tax=Microdochium trichocladiopsis TaxID=1682393 RepID=A0A9P8YHH2_9PEZI|nr:uncharacterized protein B0I36DRAFT_309898 [Microdochium trichocladiopsis]KAH7040088.1 hypothetical protein B0I36DRAFT_309898 [Microdochium trichocladiopsis]